MLWRFSAAFAMILIHTTFARPPNILFAVIDDFGWYNAGWNGNPESQTPYLDSLAQQGIILDRYYVYQVCAPSRASLLTGRWPGHGISELNPSGALALGINLNMTLLPSKLKKANYATHQIGKWHGGFYSPDFLPVNRGFDTSYGYLNGAVTHYSQLFPPYNTPEACQGVDLWNSTVNAFGRNGTCFNVSWPSPDSWGSCSDGINYNGYTFVEEATRIIEAHNAEQPFFMYLALQNTHIPLEVPEWYLNQISEDEYILRRYYDAMTRFANDAIMNVTDVLRAKGMFDDTIMVVTTDNGGSYDNGNNYPLRGAKFNFFEGGVRGSAFVYSDLLPQDIRGRKYSGLMHISDWYPTLCGLAGVDANDTGPGRVPVDGRDVWPYLLSRGNDSSPHEYVILGMNNGTNGGLLRNDGYKIIVGPQIMPFWWGPDFPNKTENCTGPELAGPSLHFIPPIVPTSCPVACNNTPCLFNVFDDPTEHHDLSSSHPLLLDEMYLQWRYLVKKLSAPNGNDPDLSDIIWQHGYHMHALGSDASGCKVVNETGWWQPWVFPQSDDDITELHVDSVER